MPLLVLVIGLAEWPYFARTARAATLVEAAKDHVRAAKALGAAMPPSFAGTYLPNILSPLIVVATTQVAGAIMAEAALVLPWPRFADHPALARHSDPIRLRPDVCRHLVGHGAPGLTLVRVLVAVNVLGDSLRDRARPAPDPTLRWGRRPNHVDKRPVRPHDSWIGALTLPGPGPSIWAVPPMRYSGRVRCENFIQFPEIWRRA